MNGKVTLENRCNQSATPPTTHTSGRVNTVVSYTNNLVH